MSYASSIPWQAQCDLLRKKCGNIKYNLILNYTIANWTTAQGFREFIIDNKLYKKPFDELILLWTLYNE